MKTLSLLNIRRPILFETALRNAGTALLRSLQNESAALDPQRRKLLEAELSRRENAHGAVGLTLLIALLAFCGAAGWL